MASMDRNNLVKDGKFCRAEIIKRAWAYVKNPFCTQYRNNYPAALRAAWADARCVMGESKVQEARFNNVDLYGVMRAASASVDMRYGTVCL